MKLRTLLLTTVIFCFAIQGFGQELKYTRLQSARHKAKYTSYISSTNTRFKVGDTLRLIDADDVPLTSVPLLISPRKFKDHDLLITEIGIYSSQDVIHTEGECEHDAQLICKDLTNAKPFKIAVEMAIKHLGFKSGGGGQIVSSNDAGGSSTPQPGKNNIGSIAADAKVLNYKSSESSAFVLKDMNDGFAVIKDGTQAALINDKGEIVVPFGKYTELGTPANGHVPAKEAKSNKWGIITYRGEVALPFNSDHEISPMDEDGFFGIGGPAPNFREFRNLKGEGIKTGEPAKDGQKYEYTFYFSDGLCRVSGGNLKGYGFANKKGEIVIRTGLWRVEEFSEGMAIVGNENEVGETKYGFINTKGEQAIPFNYTNRPGPFRNGLAHVISKTGEHAWIDKTGTIKLRSSDFPDWTLNTYEFDVPILFVVNKDRTQRGWIDQTGKVTPFAADDDNIKGLSRRAFYFADHNKDQIQIKVSEYLDNEGKIEQLFHSKEGGLYGLLDKSGTVFLPPVFYYLQMTDQKSKLSKALYYNEKKQWVEGYVNAEGVFVIVKGKSLNEW